MVQSYKLMQLLRKIVLSNKFLPLVFLFFTLQAVFYASYIGFGIPSDETYHFGAASYYADQPITTGPFTHGQTPDTIPIIRTIDRNPDYLSHYLLSLPLRLMEHFHMSFRSEVVALRLINVIFAVLALWVLKKCLDEISEEKLAKNLTILALSMTGMAVWLAGAINYDNLANLLFLLFVLVTMRFIKKPVANLALSAAILSMATILTKHTFAPVILLGLAVTVILAWKKAYRPITFWRQMKKSLKAGSYLTGFLIFFIVLLASLSIERVGLNLVRYQSVQPSCTEFFTVNECRANNVYNRNYRQARAYTADNKSNLIKNFDPFSYSGGWAYTMYNTLYFQLGDRRFESELIYRVFAALLALALVITAILSRAKLKLSKSAGYLLLLSVFYAGVLFVYNLHTYFSIGQEYAVQGRYLLPVLGFIYFFTILMVVNAYRSRKPGQKKVFVWTWILVIILFFAAHFPPYLLAKYTDSSWRQEFILPKEIID